MLKYPQFSLTPLPYMGIFTKNLPEIYGIFLEPHKYPVNMHMLGKGAIVHGGCLKMLHQVE